VVAVDVVAVLVVAVAVDLCSQILFALNK